MLYPFPDLSAPARHRLAQLPEGYDARVLADLAHRVGARGVIHVAEDESRAALLSEMLAFWSPDLAVLPFPAWDCLPYDRAPPRAGVMGQRMATLATLAEPSTKPKIVLTTVAAFVQKTLPRVALRQSSMTLAVGETTSIEALRAFLMAQGYHATPTVREAGTFAVRGGIVDIFPPTHDAPLRLDFLGDEIERLRTFDPVTQRAEGTQESLVLRPISEVILNAVTIAHFRTTWRMLFGSAVGSSQPLYDAVSEGRYLAGVEHWLGIFWPNLTSLAAWMRDSVLTFDCRATDMLAGRCRQISDLYAARQSLFEAARSREAKRHEGDDPLPPPPAPPETLYLSVEDIEALLASRTVLVLDPMMENQHVDLVSSDR